MFHKKYGTGMSEEGKVFWRGAKDLLSRAKKVLDELGMRFWMSSGTCLGKMLYLKDYLINLHY